jgi:hypothetical protein
VYRFLDKEDTVLYVGFTSNTLKHRMYQHFSSGHLDDFVYNSTYKIQYFEDNNNANCRIYEIAAMNESGALFNKDANYMQQSTIISDILSKQQWHDFNFDLNRYKKQEEDIKPKDKKIMDIINDNNYYINNLYNLGKELDKYDYGKMKECLYYIADNLQPLFNISQAMNPYLNILYDSNDTMKNILNN